MIGYTPLDPVIVVLGTIYAGYLLLSSPVKLVGWLPAVFTLYFFVPLITLLTLWQTVPLLIAGRVLTRARIDVAPSAMPVVAVLLISFIASTIYALTLGSDATRTVIRALFYLGLFGLASFAYEMTRRYDCYPDLLKGMAILGFVLALYGLYQMIAVRTGLPFRGILRGTTGVQMAFEGGFLRINSLASEPKRLSYVLLLCGLAAVFWSRRLKHNQTAVAAVGVVVMCFSLFTFSGSFYFSLFLFALAVSVLYLKNFFYYSIVGAIGALLTLTLVPNLEVFSVVQDGIERRLNEVDYGLDGQKVYRQEFFAWEYLSEKPHVAVTGVGVGQYYSTLNQEYGEGVGINEFGGLLPMNSTFLELVFDLGGIATVSFYAMLGILILQLRRAREHFLCLSLLFLVIQSFTITTIFWITLLATIGTARLQASRARRNGSMLRGLRNPSQRSEVMAPR